MKNLSFSLLSYKNILFLFFGESSFNREYFNLKEEHDKLLFLTEGNVKLKGDKEYEYFSKE